MELVVAADTVEKKLRAAVASGVLRAGDDVSLVREGIERGVIERRDADLIRDAEAARREVIQVDDFSPAYWADRLPASPPERALAG